MAAKRSGLALAAAALIGSAAFAHHSPAAFDMTQEVVIEGTIAEVAWKNPHIYLTLETAGADGSPLRQEVEVGPLSAVQTYGLTEQDVAVGSHVVVRANPNRRGEGRTVRGLDLTTSDGVVHALTDRGRNSAPPVVDVAAESLAGTWVAPPAALEALRRAAPTWPLTEAGRAALAEAQAQGAPPRLHLCEGFPSPALTSVPGFRSIEVAEDTVVLRFDAEGVAIERAVHLDQSEHPADLEPTMQGHSIGWWEGETLVIDTVAFAPHPAGVSIGVPSGPGKHMLERLTLTEDRLHLAYEFTLEDPEYLQGPVSVATEWDHRPDVAPSGVACDPEVARRFLEEEAQ
jgi:hypothetical protein